MDQAWSEEAQLFYEPLISTYLDSPGTVARDWMWDEIRERLSRPSCRFVLLVGEPGAGKTGLMAALARRNPDWLRYFVRLDSTTPLSSSDATSMFLRVGHQPVDPHKLVKAIATTLDRYRKTHPTLSKAVVLSALGVVTETVAEDW